MEVRVHHDVPPLPECGVRVFGIFRIVLYVDSVGSGVGIAVGVDHAPVVVVVRIPGDVQPRARVAALQKDPLAAQIQIFAFGHDDTAVGKKTRAALGHEDVILVLAALYLAGLEDIGPASVAGGFLPIEGEVVASVHLGLPERETVGGLLVLPLSEHHQPGTVRACDRKRLRLVRVVETDPHGVTGFHVETVDQGCRCPVVFVQQCAAARCAVVKRNLRCVDGLGDEDVSSGEEDTLSKDTATMKMSLKQLLVAGMVTFATALVMTLC